MDLFSKIKTCVMLISKKTFSKDYLKNYIVQGVSLILRFLSLLIVVPALSENPELYGVYAVCISVVVFLSYVDLGFLTSSIKYASESYSQGNRDEEMNFIGFGGMVTLLVTMLLSIVFFLFKCKSSDINCKSKSR